MTNKIIIIGHNIDPTEHLRVMLKTLHAFGRDIEHPTIESVTQILHDEYDTEVSIQNQPPRIQEIAYEQLLESIKICVEMRKYIPDDISHKKSFSYAHQKHYNRLQNVRIKAFKSRHR